MQTIEAQMHNLLEEIAPEAHSPEEQAKIIAQASSIYKKIFTNRRFAKRADQKIIESHMTDAILQAMGSLNNWVEEYTEPFIDGAGLTNRQVISRVSTSSKPKWGTMDVLNPEVLSFMDMDDEEALKTSDDVFEKDYDNNVVNVKENSQTKLLENAQQTSQALKTPGRGKHRSDFISDATR